MNAILSFVKRAENKGISNVKVYRKAARCSQNNFSKCSLRVLADRLTKVLLRSMHVVP